MPQEPKTWRDMLLKIIENSDQRARIAEALDVTEKTIGRWATGINTPKISTMVGLIEVIPSWYREAFSNLVIAEFPEMTKRVEATGLSLEETVSDIQSVLYDRVLHERIHAFSPVSQWGMSMLILQQCASQLDTDRTGIIAIVTKCAGPPPIKQLRNEYMEVSSFWPGEISKQRFFRGSESIAGAVVESLQPLVVNNTKQGGERIEPQVEGINSFAIYPILSFGNIAGCLVILSSEFNHFTSRRIELLRRYSELLSLAFPDGEFYAAEQIQLQIVPEHAVQLLMLERMQQLVYKELTQAEQHDQYLDRHEAEQRVLKRMLQQGEHRSEPGPTE